jgi:hypothetical protein
LETDNKEMEITINKKDLRISHYTLQVKDDEAKIAALELKIKE